ncbi:MAG TPA: AbrB/MazE/SpoVT family DNA-binding domain-containing protein [Anaerolineales bacterium]
MPTLQIRSKGTITLPASLRKKYKLEEGEVLTIIDLGEGTFLLKPKALQIDKLSKRAVRVLKDDNVLLEDLFKTLDEEHKKYYEEKYGKK